MALATAAQAAPDGGVAAAARDPGLDAFTAGRRYYELGEMVGAKQALDEAVAIKPDFSPAYLYRALVVEDTVGMAAARADFDKAVALDPKSKENHRYYAEALLKTGEYDLVKQHLDAALAADPSYADAVWLMGDMLRQQKQLKEAIPWFERHLALRPNGDGHHALGFIYLNLGDDARAREEFAKDLVATPTCDSARSNLAALLQDAGKTKDAIEQYKLALAYHPDDPLMLRGLARAYADVGDYEMAVGSYRQTLDVAPQDEEAKAGLVSARRKQHLRIALPWAAPPTVLLLGGIAFLGIRRRRTKRSA